MPMPVPAPALDSTIPFVCEQLRFTGYRHSIRPIRSDYGLQTGLLHTLCEDTWQDILPPPTPQCVGKIV